MSSERLRYLLSAKAVREQAHRILQLCREGKTHFKLHADRLPEVAEFVAQVTKENYPDLQVPFHSRWGHFRAGLNFKGKALDIPRIQSRWKSFVAGKNSGNLSAKSSDHAPSGEGSEKYAFARWCFDLVIPSVLLDAGAGMRWRFTDHSETSNLVQYSKSEGLALASLAWFDAVGGKVSADLLSKTTPELISKTFQVTSANPLLGVEGRADLLKALGNCLKKNRMESPGALVDILVQKHGMSIPAGEILNEILRQFGPIWPGRLNLMGTALGDCWKYSGFEEGERLVPFHKLSQWMTYSLIEPLEAVGLTVTQLDELTGLPEYRNGGLLLDSRLISLRDPDEIEKIHEVDSELVVEWRALTVALLDELADEIRKILKKEEKQFPLAKVLEGGTWWAGRRLASKLRQDGGPPLIIKSDGTVF